MEDRLGGIYDDEQEHEFIDAEKSNMVYTKSNQVGSSKGIIYYTNFMLTEKNTKFYRIAYTSMDVLGEVGGLIEGAKIILILLLFPFNYNLNQI